MFSITYKLPLIQKLENEPLSDIFSLFSYLHKARLYELKTKVVVVTESLKNLP